MTCPRNSRALALFALLTTACPWIGDQEHAGRLESLENFGPADSGSADADGDGYGEPDDCDDADAGIHPGADEICDGADNDCDGDVDEDGALDAPSWYADSDGDGFGDEASVVAACAQPSGHVDNATDCDDGDGAVNPGADELCDGVDNDCNGETDEDEAKDAATWYADTDGDGFGDSANSAVDCYQPKGYVAYGAATDCDDSDAAVNPGASEVRCDDVDDDCDGGANDHDLDLDGYAAMECGGDDCDDDDAELNPADADKDQFSTCQADCDDTDGTLYPGAVFGHQGIHMTCIGRGRFTMGAPKSEEGSNQYVESQHEVTLTGSFWLSVHPVTKEEFEELMLFDPSYFPKCVGCPVEGETWHEAAEFANAVSDLSGLSACYSCSGTTGDLRCELDAAYATPYDCEGYRLLTEAEWEYAARAGTSSAFPNGANLVKGASKSCDSDLQLDDGSLLVDVAWFCGSGIDETTAVGQLAANPWGLYDMHGLTWEWCHDYWDVTDYDGDGTDPWGDATGSYRAIRGGHWGSYPWSLRSATRNYEEPAVPGYIGFRLARSE